MTRIFFLFGNYFPNCSGHLLHRVSGSKYQGPLNGGVSNGEFSRSGLVLPFLSFWDFPDFSGIFPICWGEWSGDFPDLSFSSFSAY